MRLKVMDQMEWVAAAFGQLELEVDSIHSALESEFPTDRLPAMPGPPYDDDEVEENLKLLGRRRWNELTRKDVDGVNWLFLSGPAMNYYLPAYITSSLDDFPRLKRSLERFPLAVHLVGKSEIHYLQTSLASFTEKQLELTARYVRLGVILGEPVSVRSWNILWRHRFAAEEFPAGQSDIQALSNAECGGDIVSSPISMPEVSR